MHLYNKNKTAVTQNKFHKKRTGGHSESYPKYIVGYIVGVGG